MIFVSSFWDRMSQKEETNNFPELEKKTINIILTPEIIS